MERCKFCGAETELFQNGIPICPKCADDYEQLVKKTPGNKPETTPVPDDLKRSG